MDDEAYIGNKMQHVVNPNHIGETDNPQQTFENLIMPSTPTKWVRYINEVSDEHLIISTGEEAFILRKDFKIVNSNDCH